MTLRLAHIADLHLGFRQFSRQTAGGMNQREADVAVAFRRVLEDVVAQQPDVVLVAGDVFHSVRPANPAILDSFNQFRRLREGLPHAPIVIVAGNHDTPRSTDTVTILRLFEAIPDVFVVTHEPQAFRFDSLGLAVTGYPRESFVSAPRPVVLPERGIKHNVLVMHGEIAGVVPGDRTFAFNTGTLMELGDLHAERWTYVALGHYHVATEVTRNAWYAGSAEFVSSNPWAELDTGPRGYEGRKGWLLVTLDGDDVGVEFRPVETQRRHVDLPRIFCAGMSAEEVDQAIARNVANARPEIAQQVVRQVLHDIPRLVSRDLNHRAIREFKTRALHYRLDSRRPAPVREVGLAEAGTRQTLPELLEEFLTQRPITPGVDRGELLKLGREYLAQTAVQDPAD